MANPCCRPTANLGCFSCHKVVCLYSSFSALKAAPAVLHAVPTWAAVAEDFWSARQCPGEPFPLLESTEERIGVFVA